MIEKNEEIANKCEAFAREIFAERIKKTTLYVPFDKILSRCSTGLNPRKNFVLGHGSRFPGCREKVVNSEDPLPIVSSIRSTGCVPRPSACLPCTCGSTAITCAYGWTRKRSRGKKMGSKGSADTCRSSTEESSCPGKPSEDGMFSPFSNTFVYPSLSLINKKNPYDNTYEFLLLTMVTPKGFGPLNPALRGL